MFQGDVDSTARKTPKELVQWFEDVSSSSELKERYEDAFKKTQDAEANTRTAWQKQNGFMKKRRKLKDQKKEVEKFKVELLTDVFPLAIVSYSDRC